MSVSIHHGKASRTSTASPSHVQFISAPLTEFYGADACIQYHKIFIPSDLKEIPDRSIYISGIFLYATVVHHADLRAVIHDDIISAHFYSRIWNIEIFTEFQLSAHTIDFHCIQIIFIIVFKYQANPVITEKCTYDLLFYIDCFAFFGNLASW